MAKINIAVDTKEKTHEVTVNGTKVENLRDISISRYPGYKGGADELSFSASTYDSDEDNDVRRVTYIMASAAEGFTKAKIFGEDLWTKTVASGVESFKNWMKERRGK